MQIPSARRRKASCLLWQAMIAFAAISITDSSVNCKGRLDILTSLTLNNYMCLLPLAMGALPPQFGRLSS